MRRFSKGFFAILVLAGTALSLIIFLAVNIILTENASPEAAIHATPTLLNIEPFDMHSSVFQENQLPGSTHWQLDPSGNHEFIQAYVDQVSALPGQVVGLHVSALHPVRYRLEVYRIGWYGGMGGRLLLTKDSLLSPAKGTWFLETPNLASCKVCYQDPKTHLIEARWPVSYHLTIGANWTSGVYLLKIIAANGAETYATPLVVRAAHSSATALVNLPVMTYQAYNLWGGYSLYQHKAGPMLPGRAVKVSFDRPYTRGTGAADFLSWDIQTIRWLERYSVDATYTTDVDVSANQTELLHHRLYLDIGHDEYWTKAMRDGVDLAKAKGVSIAFLGANDSFWQARLEADLEKHTNRTLVCYKVSSHSTKPDELLKNDPAYPAHKDIVTAHWGDPLINRPEKQLTGLDYLGAFSRANYYPNWVVSDATDPLFYGTGLHTGSVVSGGLVGYEADGIQVPSRDTIEPYVHIISRSPVYSDLHGTSRFACSAYYIDPSSHAFVFDAGTIWWGLGLDGITPLGATDGNHVRGTPPISRLTANIITAMLAATPAAPVPTSE